MRGIKNIILVLCILLANPVFAQGSAKIETNNPRIAVSASEGIYHGHKCLVINLKDGNVPINAPARQLKLLSDENNAFISYGLTQISPGKFVTTEDIVLEQSDFKLRFLNSKRIKDISISFKDN